MVGRLLRLPSPYPHPEAYPLLQPALLRTSPHRNTTAYAAPNRNATAYAYRYADTAAYRYADTAAYRYADTAAYRYAAAPHATPAAAAYRHAAPDAYRHSTAHGDAAADSHVVAPLKVCGGTQRSGFSRQSQFAQSAGVDA